VTVSEVDSDQPAGTAIATNPAAGQQAAADQAITLQVSGGAAEISVPTAIVGQPEQQARQTLATAGFTGTITIQDLAAEAGQTVGTVAGSDPTPGSSVAADGEITLIVYRQAPDEGGTGGEPGTGGGDPGGNTGGAGG
jgi:serine/threonine-protein kinase